MQVNIRFLNISDASLAEDLGEALLTSPFKTFELAPVKLSKGVTAYQNGGLFTTSLDGRTVFVKAFNGTSDIQNALLATNLAPDLFPKVFGFGAEDGSSLVGGGSVSEDQILKLLDSDDKEGFLKLVGEPFERMFSMAWDHWRENIKSVADELSVAMNKRIDGNPEDMERIVREIFNMSYEQESEEQESEESESEESESESEKHLDYERYWMNGNQFRKMYLFVEPMDCDFELSKVKLADAQDLISELHSKGIRLSDFKRDNFCYTKEKKAVYVDFGGFGGLSSGEKMENVIELDDGSFQSDKVMEGGGRNNLSIGALVGITAFMCLFSSIY